MGNRGGHLPRRCARFVQKHTSQVKDAKKRVFTTQCEFDKKIEPIHSCIRPLVLKVKTKHGVLRGIVVCLVSILQTSKHVISG